MADRAELIEEFREGTTPSGLIRHLLANHGGAVDHWTLRDYFAEAFALTTALPLRAGEEGVCDEARCATLDRVLLEEMLLRRSQWDADSPGGSASWFDGLKTTSPEELKETARAAPYPGLSAETWATLTPAEKEALAVQLASTWAHAERVAVLARLAERLQRRVEEAEGRVLARQGV
jgi:hypothetical protein